MCDSLDSFNFLFAQSQPKRLYFSSLKVLHEPQCIPQAATSFSKSIPKLDIPLLRLKTPILGLVRARFRLSAF
jgi:hypothetical protein